MSPAAPTETGRGPIDDTMRLKPYRTVSYSLAWYFTVTAPVADRRCQEGLDRPYQRLPFLHSALGCTIGIFDRIILLTVAIFVSLLHCNGFGESFNMIHIPIPRYFSHSTSRPPSPHTFTSPLFVRSTTPLPSIHIYRIPHPHTSGLSPSRPDGFALLTSQITSRLPYL